MKGINRQVIRFFFLLVLPTSVVLLGADHWIKSTRFVKTENAYVKAHLLSISSDLDGRTVKLHVKPNEIVKKGDPLFELDSEPFEIDLARAQAELISIKFDLDALREELFEARAQLSDAKAEVVYSERVFKRQKELSQRGVASRVRLEEAERELNIARQHVRTTRHSIGRVMAKLGGDVTQPVDRHPSYLEARGRVESAKLNLRHTTIFSPANGTVGSFALQPGEYVQKGKPVIPIIQSDEKWIQANLKETQLTHIGPGQNVEVTIDAYPDEPLEAKVISISPTTGAELSILPPQNASGNWVKVVQRVPVRIEFSNKKIIRKLRSGMTVQISIDTGRERSLLAVIKSSFANTESAE